MAARAHRKPAPEAPPVALAPAPPAFGAYAVNDFTRQTQCRFPCSSNGSDHRFCGRPTEIGPGNPYGSWCDVHLDVVFEGRGGGREARRQLAQAKLQGAA